VNNLGATLNEKYRYVLDCSNVDFNSGVFNLVDQLQNQSGWDIGGHQLNLLAAEVLEAPTLKIVSQ
jgi:hypothetical protein